MGYHIQLSAHVLEICGSHVYSVVHLPGLCNRLRYSGTSERVPDICSAKCIQLCVLAIFPLVTMEAYIPSRDLDNCVANNSSGIHLQIETC